MRLPNFLEATEILTVRRRMGIPDHEIVELGQSSWKDWGGFGVDVEDINLIEVHADRTLVYEGLRILVYIRDQWLAQDGQDREYRYHIADCKTLQKMRENKRFGRYVATNRTDGSFVVNRLERGSDDPVESGVERTMEVCRNCLTELDWDGYGDASRVKRTEIHGRFSPATMQESSKFSDSRVIAAPRAA